MTSLACALAIAFAAATPSGATALTNGEISAPLPNGVYAVEGGSAVSVDQSTFQQSPVSLELADGKARFAYACLSYGAAFYTAGKDGVWSFAQGTLSTKGCPKQVARVAAETMVALTGGTTWRPADGGLGGKFTVNGKHGTVNLGPSTARAPGAEPADDPNPTTAIVGEWRVEAITRPDGAKVQESGPYTWTMTVGADAITIPTGATATQGYAATPSGAFVFVEPTGAKPMAASFDVATEWADLRVALSEASRWSAPSPTTVVLTGQGVRVALARPAATNAALQAKTITPGATTVRVAVGQTVRLPVSALPKAPRAIGQATVNWKNTRGAVVGVSRVGARAKVRKTGTVMTPMGTAGVAQIKLTGRKRGTSRVTLTAAGSGASATVKVVVVNQRRTPTKVRIKGGKNWQSLSDGRWAVDLDAVVKPAKATAVVEWSSSVPSLATVDPTGLVTLSGAWQSYKGKITITAKAGPVKRNYSLALPTR